MTTQTDETTNHGRSVVAGVLLRLSVSQLKKHKLCPRAWYFQKVMRIPEPSTGPQNIGTEGHAQIEHYLTTGENVLGVFALSGFHLLPAPGPDLMVEQQLDGEPPLMAGGVPFTGFIDLVNPRRLAEGILRVTDHKFTSNIANNAATAEQLASADAEAGLQMLGYGAWALRQGARFPGLRVLELEHIYYQTRGQRLAESVLVTVPIEHVAHEWASKVEPQVELMKTHAQAARASDVPANFGPACSKFGGCPFMAKCLSGESKTMSLRDRLLKGTPNASPSPNTDGVAAVVRNPPEQLGQCPDCGEQLTRDNASRLVSGAVRHVMCPKEPPAVLPPDAPPPDPVTGPTDSPKPAAEPPAAEQPAPKRRGRPRKTPAAEQLTPEPEQAAPLGSSMGDLRVLFVDCIPTVFDALKPETLTRYVDELHRKVAEAGGVDDIRFAGGESPLGFGKWRGALAMAARAELPRPGSYVVLGLAQSELLQVVVEAIEPAFDVIVRGVR